ncbi:MAG: sugar phosphate isomerase/epimerase [candidate division Zixibacteria bacterium]|nr:sugar phosphate isomerase/epimerase [candidate division Zixibacteria bacterium]
MKFSLSVRVAEAPGSKEKTIRSLVQIADLAANLGYHALCMRASQVGIHTPIATASTARKIIADHHLAVSMITGDFPTPINNDQAPNALRNITPYLDLADLLGVDLIRIAMKREEDIAWAQRAADETRERRIRLAHQSHTQSLFETTDGSIATLKKVNRPNFGLIYEPANLDLCGEDYGSATLRRFAPWLFNVYLQNHLRHADGKSAILTWKQGTVHYDPIRLQDTGGINFPHIFDTLSRMDYDGYITVHQAFTEIMEPEQAAQESIAYLKTLDNL